MALLNLSLYWTGDMTVVVWFLGLPRMPEAFTHVSVTSVLPQEVHGMDHRFHGLIIIDADQKSE